MRAVVRVSLIVVDTLWLAQLAACKTLASTISVRGLEASHTRHLRLETRSRRLEGEKLGLVD